jgi:hypothetical protein
MQPPDDFSNEHVYQEVTHRSWFDRLIGSVGGLLMGLLLFVGSFFVLFFNEGSIDFSKVARQAQVVSPAAIQSQAQGKWVALTGTIASSQPLGDNLHLKPGPYIALSRTVEMFAWKEDESRETQRNLGGSETTVTTYRYSTEWTDSPEDSDKFRKSNYVNPSKAIANQIFKVANAKIGVYAIDMARLTEATNFPYSCTSDSRRYSPHYGNGIRFPDGNRLNLTPQILMATKAQVFGDYLFQGAGANDAPKVGDLRICYNALPNPSTVTVLGQLQGDRIVPGLHQKQAFFRLSSGSLKESIGDLRNEYLIWLWFFRVLGFLMMWFGLMMVAQPISVVLSVVPFLGDLAEMISGAASFVVALVLSFTAIVVSSLIHQPVVLFGSVMVALTVLWAGRKLMHR